MEKQMRQIMKIFAKERQSRRREIQRLQIDLADRSQQLLDERKRHETEKAQIMAKWREHS